MTPGLRRLTAEAAVLAGGERACDVLGHDWQFVGGAPCGCDNWNNCSVPVNECASCADCDYGQNPEGDAVRANCREALS